MDFDKTYLYLNFINPISLVKTLNIVSLNFWVVCGTLKYDIFY